MQVLLTYHPAFRPLALQQKVFTAMQVLLDGLTKILEISYIICVGMCAWGLSGPQHQITK